MDGKDKCRILKDIRRRIAEENGIPFETEECTHTGECSGTCPYCESEVRYLEDELVKRKTSLGKVVLATGLTLAFSSCHVQKPSPDNVVGIVPAEIESIEGEQEASSQKTPQDGSSDLIASGKPVVRCSYRKFNDSVRGKIPHDPEPTHESVAKILSEKIVYPEWMAQQGVTGIVKVSFMLEKPNKIVDISIEESSDTLFSNAVVEALKELDGMLPEPEYDRQGYYFPVSFDFEGK